MVEELEYGFARAAADARGAIHVAHSQRRGACVERPPDVRRQRVRKEVGGDGIEAAFWDEDGAGGAGEGVVFGEEGVDPGDFTGGVDVVGSGVGAGGEEGFAVDCVGEGALAGGSDWRG